MRIEAIETLSGDSDGEHVVLRQRFSSSTRRLRDAVILGAGLMLAMPIATVLADDMARQHFAEMAVSNPRAVVLLVACGLIASAAIAIGAISLARQDPHQRTVAIDPDGVIVEDLIGGRAQRWREAISDFRGIRHRVWTTSQGVRHVLMLEHDQPGRTIHLACEPYISQANVVQTADRFGLPVLKPVILSQSSFGSRVLSVMTLSRTKSDRAQDDLARA